MFGSSRSWCAVWYLGAVVLLLFSIAGITSYRYLLGTAFSFYAALSFSYLKLGKGWRAVCPVLRQSRYASLVGPVEDYWDGSRWRRQWSVFQRSWVRRGWLQQCSHQVSREQSSTKREAPACSILCLEFTALAQHVWQALKIQVTCMKESKILLFHAQWV